MVGVYSRDLVEPLAHVLKNLGARHAFVVSGTDGLDEVTTTSTSIIAEAKDDSVQTYEFDPAEVGVKRSRLEDLSGADPEANARITNAILEGEKGPRRDIVALNAAFALVAADHVENVSEGIEAASHSIDSGAALEKLRHLREASSS